jgi:hypothetical protein
MRTTLLLGVLCAACGAEEKATEQAAQLETDTPRQTNEVGDEGEEVLVATSVLAVREEPVCEMKLNGRMIYVIPTKKFKTCDATTGSWYEIEVKGDPGAVGEKGDGGTTGVKGDRGEAGDKGEKGETGARGDVGATGVAGATGATGRDGQVAAGNMWYDAVDDKWWVRGSVAIYADASFVCNEGDTYRLPTWAELHWARLRGLCVVDARCNTNPSNAWYQSTTYEAMSMFGATTTTLDSSTNAITYCIER